MRILEWPARFRRPRDTGQMALAADAVGQNRDEIERALAVLETAARAGKLAEEDKRRIEGALVAHDSRASVQRTLALYRSPAPLAIPEAAEMERALKRFQAQYDALPEGNILNIKRRWWQRKGKERQEGWQEARARIMAPENAEKMRKVLTLQGGGRLYAVMEDGSLEFMDDHPETPPMFVKDEAVGQLRIVYDRDENEMRQAQADINAGTHQWASIQEMLDWAKENGFEVFEAEAKDKRRFGREMRLAEAASPEGLFVGKKGGSLSATALKQACHAYFYPSDGDVYVYVPFPGARVDFLGLLRRLRV